MTLNELRTEVSALGFEPGANTDPILISAANRALAMISTEIPIIKTLRAPASQYAPIYYLASLHHTSGERIELTLSGRAYSFSVSGKGRFTEISDSGRIMREFDTELSDFRGFIDESVRILFDGDGDFDLLELSVFDKVGGSELSDIPTVLENRIKADELVDDLFAFTEPPRDVMGRIISGARIEGRELVLPLEYRGIATVKYESRPKRISREGGEIDVNPSAEHLLPILTAYFVWLDDEPVLAESYLKLYQGLLAALKRRVSSSTCEYTDALGWS